MRRTHKAARKRGALTLNWRRLLTLFCRVSVIAWSKLPRIFIASCGFMRSSLMRSSSVSVRARPILERAPVSACQWQPSHSHGRLLCSRAVPAPTIELVETLCTRRHGCGGCIKRAGPVERSTGVEARKLAGETWLLQGRGCETAVLQRRGCETLQGRGCEATSRRRGNNGCAQSHNRWLRGPLSHSNGLLPRGATSCDVAGPRRAAAPAGNQPAKQLAGGARTAVTASTITAAAHSPTFDAIDRSTPSTAEPPSTSKQHRHESRRDEPLLWSRRHYVVSDHRGSVYVQCRAAGIPSFRGWRSPWCWLTNDVDCRHALHRQRRVLQRRRVLRISVALRLGWPWHRSVHWPVGGRRRLVSITNPLSEFSPQGDQRSMKRAACWLEAV